MAEHPHPRRTTAGSRALYSRRPLRVMIRLPWIHAIDAAQDVGDADRGQPAPRADEQRAA